jgi:CRP-like cAMP-binding protein
LHLQGEPGSKLYIVDTGILEVTINGEKVREMSKGSMLGELALLYDAPRSATVRWVTHKQQIFLNQIMQLRAF